MHRISIRERILRENRWSDKFGVIGNDLTGATVGIVGLGRIGYEFSRLVQPFEVDLVAFDPYADAVRAHDAGLRLVDLKGLLRVSDVICLTVPLTPETQYMIGAREFELMKRSALLVNAARGPVVREDALIAALRSGRIAGAALDVFDPEPPLPDNPLLAMDNVLLTPHAIAHTEALYRDGGHQAISGILAVARGDLPPHIVNRPVLERARFLDKLARTTRYSRPET